MAEPLPLDIEPARRPDVTLHELNSDGRPDVAVVECPDGDEALWWSLVLRDAQEREWEYGLDEADPETVTSDGREYDEAKVATWLREHVEPPRWAWHHWTPASEEEQDFWEVAAWLQTSSAAERPGPDWWRGATVTLRDTP